MSVGLWFQLVCCWLSFAASGLVACQWAFGFSWCGVLLAGDPRSSQPLFSKQPYEARLSFALLQCGSCLCIMIQDSALFYMMRTSAAITLGQQLDYEVYSRTRERFIMQILDRVL